MPARSRDRTGAAGRAGRRGPQARRSRPGPGWVPAARSRPASVSMVRIWRAPIYSTPNTSPRIGEASSNRTCSGRTPSTRRSCGTSACSCGTAIEVPHRATAAGSPADLPLAGEEAHGRAADEGGHEHAARAMVDLGRRAGLEHAAAVHDGDPVGHRHGLDLVVGDVDGGGADPLVQALQLLAHQLAEGGIERAQRLVHEEGLGPADDGTAQRHPLAVAAGEPAHPLAEQVVDAQEACGLLHPLPDLGPGHADALEREADVLPHVHVRIEGEELEHEGDVALAGAQEGDVLAAQPDLARGRQLEPGDHAQASWSCRSPRGRAGRRTRRPRW